MGEALREPRPGQPISPDQRQNPEVRKRLSGPALRTFFNMADAWALSVNEQRALLGWPATSTLHKYKNGLGGTLPYDMLIRISLVLGIYTALHVLYPEPDLADRWLQLPNTNVLFSGRPPMALLVDGGMDALYQVRRLLDGRRGGWN